MRVHIRRSGVCQDITAPRLFFRFLPACDTSRKRESTSVVPLNDQELLVALDEGDGCTQSSKQRKPTVESQAGTRHDPEQAATRFHGAAPRKSSTRNFRQPEWADPG